MAINSGAGWLSVTSRGTPLLMQLFIIYYGLPGLGITLSRELSAFLAVGFNGGAYQAEYLRGSILAIGDGQMVADRAIGMFLIAVPELMAKAKSIAAQTYDPIGSYPAVAIVYLAIVYFLDAALRWLERASRIPGFEMEGKKA